MPIKYVRKRPASPQQRKTLENLKEALKLAEQMTFVLKRHLDPTY